MTALDAASTENRRHQLGTALAAVRERIGNAVRQRSAAAPPPRLIVVTKYFPASDVALLAGLGITDVGESRDQEAAAKAQELSGLDLRWHFIGQLQTNKARSVVRYAYSVQSVDRPGLVAALDKAMTGEQQRLAVAGQPGRAPLRCHLQVNLSVNPGDSPDHVAGPAGRGGARPADISALAELVAAAPQLELAGVMAVAPRGTDPAEAFDRLARVSHELRRSYPTATDMSAGMSADLEAAVLAGATHLRVGSDVLGPRHSIR